LSSFSSLKLSLALILQSKAMLREMIEMRRKEERIASGALTVGEVQRLLQLARSTSAGSTKGSDARFDDGDAFATAVSGLKTSIIDELRRNAALEKDVAKLDGRIALLIKNRGNVQLLDDAAKGVRAMLARYRRKEDAEDPEVSMTEAARRVDALFSDKDRMTLYSQLFYVLQTEPRYLAAVIFATPERHMDAFLDTTVLSLFGDSLSPREDYLLLELFRHMILLEAEHCKSITDLTAGESVLPRAVARYARRKTGVAYLRDVLVPWLARVADASSSDLDLQMKPSVVWQAIVNAEEVRTGEHSDKPRNLSDADAMQQPECAKAVRANVEAALELCDSLVGAVCTSAARVPYGLRWICRLVQQLADDKFPLSTADEVFKVVSYFVYYRFLNPAITAPENFNIVDTQISTATRKNLVSVGRLMQNLFTLTYFDEKKEWMAPVNDWIRSQVDRVRTFFADLMDVDAPEEVLQLDTYMELAQKSRPVIVMSALELTSMHRRLAELVDTIAPAADDPVRVVLRDLKEPPDETTIKVLSSPDPSGRGGTRDTQLTLINRFKDAAEEAISNQAASLYESTKALIITALRDVPIVDGEDVTLLQMLRSGKKFAKVKGNAGLLDTCRTALEQLQMLEGHRDGLVAIADDYMGVLRDIALELANRKAVRERRRAEVARLEKALAALRDTQGYLGGQIDQYSTYLTECRRAQQAQADAKNRRSDKTSFFKKVAGGGGATTTSTGATDARSVTFTHAYLKKRSVIVDSDVPKPLQGKTDFAITETTPGTFHIVGNVPGVRPQELDLEIDELLQLQDAGTQSLELDSVVLDVNMTLSLLNKHFYSRR
jgi:hypothetical protein